MRAFLTGTGLCLHLHAALDRGKRGMQTVQKTSAAGLTAFMRTLTWVLLAAGSSTACAAGQLATALGRQARALWQRWLLGELTISFRNDFVAHARTSRKTKTTLGHSCRALQHKRPLFPLG